MSKLQLAKIGAFSIETVYGRTDGRTAATVIPALQSVVTGVKVELEDALACDDEVLEEVFQFADPPLSTAVRCPQMFIAQLRYELGWFLHLVYDYGIPVFYWAHQQFADVVRKRYLLRCAS